MPYRILISSLLCLVATHAAADSPLLQVAQAEARDIAVEQWQVLDIVFQTESVPEGNPFDIEFGAIYTGPQGRRMQVPGFYNGDGRWISRFSSNVTGQWAWTTYSSLPALSGLTGSLTATANTREHEHGGVIISPDRPQAFQREDGGPHFLLAFELDWLFALDYHQPEGLPKTHRVLDQVRENGFNHVVMNVYAYDVGWKVASDVPQRYFYGRPSYSVFGGTNESPDFSTLNLKLLQHLDQVIATMQSKGLDAHLMIYVWNKKVNWPEMYSPADNRFFDHIIDRYQAFSNVVWDVSKEALDYGRCDIPYINERIERIRRRDAFRRLVTVHDYEYNSREADRVDFISIQSWRSGLQSLMLQAREVHADKPVVNIEHGGYERGPYQSFAGNYTDPRTCLIRTYECIFAGVYGSYYWQNAAWNIVIDDPFDEGHDFDPPRLDYYRHLAGLFHRYDFSRLQPSRPKLTTNSRLGDDNLATNGFALHDGAGLYLMWIPAESEKVHTVLPQPASGKLDITWFHPLSGQYLEKGLTDWSGWKEFASPWPGDPSVLIISAEPASDR